MSKERFTIEHFGEFDDVESFIYDNKTQRGILKSYNYGYNDLMEMLDFINQQDLQISVLERALQLAVVELKKSQHPIQLGKVVLMPNDKLYSSDFFKSQAEQEIKEEKE